jgi:hypothetical protein
MTIPVSLYEGQGGIFRQNRLSYLPNRFLTWGNVTLPWNLETDDRNVKQGA